MLCKDFIHSEVDNLCCKVQKYNNSLMLMTAWLHFFFNFHNVFIFMHSLLLWRPLSDGQIIKLSFSGEITI